MVELVKLEELVKLRELVELKNWWTQNNEELIVLGAPRENWLDWRIGNIRRIGRDLKIMKI